MKINEVEAAVGVTKKNIRFYEEEGLISPSREPGNGYRSYSQADVERLRRIKLLRKLDVPLAEIREMLEGQRTLAEGMSQQLERLRSRRADLEEAIGFCTLLQLEIGPLELLDVEQTLARLAAKEEQGVTFVDIEQVDRKAERIKGALVGAGLFTAIMLLTIGIMAWSFCIDPQDVPPLPPGCRTAPPTAAYANYMAFAISAGAVIRTVTTTIEEGFSLPKVEKFEELINERTKAILICNPNNPTGYLYTRREMNQIRDMVKKYDLYLFSDEVYREFIYTGSPYISACHLEGIEENVVLIDSVSKRYSECGIRIGALITKNKEVRNAVMKFCQARLSPPLIGQIAAEASLDAPEEYTRETYDEYVERRKCLIDGLNRIPGVYSPIPMGAFYTVAKLPVDDSEKFCAWCLSEFNYEGETVMMAPAAGFYTTPGAGRNEVRIAYVLKKEDLVRALFVLRKALEAYPGRVED